MDPYSTEADASRATTPELTAWWPRRRLALVRNPWVALSPRRTPYPGKLSRLKETGIMATLTFDTLRFANRLMAAGVPPEHAEAEAAALSEVLEVNLKELATKDDLKALEMKLDGRFERLMGDIMLLKWMLGILIAGVVSLILKSFF